MKYFVQYRLHALLVVMLSWFATANVYAADKPNDAAYATTAWEELIPKAELDALLNPPSYLDDIAEGSEFEDNFSSQIADAIAASSDDAYQQALTSTNVVEAFNNKPIRIAGFIAPLDFDDDMNVTEFFLVPYFGACLHLPPPPPNQIIHVTDTKGIALDRIDMPFWISGVVSTQLIDNGIAKSAYSMTLDNYEVYDVDEQASIQATKASPKSASTGSSSVIISKRLSG